MTLIAVFIVLYALLILAHIYGFLIQKGVSTSAENAAHTHFSVLIPFRNEAENLPRLLHSIEQLHYPKTHFEVLLIDDESSDASVQIIEAFQQHTTLQLRIIKNRRESASPKKDALNAGIKTASYDWIVTTDADCAVPENWLHCFDQKIQKEQPLFIAGPVSFFTQQGLLHYFQQLDFLSLQGATLGSFGLKQAFMCNGANLAFAKTEFLELKGYSQNDHLASGDDVFLLQKFLKAYPDRVAYLKQKEALILTQAQSNWKNLFNQRKRWAAKASAYTSYFALITAFMVFIGNLSTILSVFYLAELGPLIVLKLAVDFILIYLTAHLFNQTATLKNYIWVALLYPFITVYIALTSQLKSFEWKGRSFKK